MASSSSNSTNIGRDPRFFNFRRVTCLKKIYPEDWNLPKNWHKTSPSNARPTQRPCVVELPQPNRHQVAEARAAAAALAQRLLYVEEPWVRKRTRPAKMSRYICKFDTSDYPADNIHGMPQVNKKVLGLIKDECNGRIITEFVGLRSKMYSIRVEDQDFIKKAKGVKEVVVKKTITFDDYVYCLKNVEIQARTQYTIRSKLHNVQTLKQTKIALSPYDDKRYLLKNSTDTLAWGHCKLNNLDSNDIEMPLV